jgi:putative transcriptional regulator
MAEKRTQFGRDMEEALREALAHQRGAIALPTRLVSPIAPEQVKAIRKAVAKSPRQFEQRFGVPARTLEGWEQGRKLDQTACVLLTVIEKEPEAVTRALRGRMGFNEVVNVAKKAARASRRAFHTTTGTAVAPSHRAAAKMSKGKSGSRGQGVSSTKR